MPSTLRLLNSPSIPMARSRTKQYLEWTDSAYQAYDKVTFAPIYSSPLPADTPFVQNNLSNCCGTDGSGVILFDHLASRWVVAVHEGTSAASGITALRCPITDDLTASNFAWYAPTSCHSIP